MGADAYRGLGWLPPEGEDPSVVGVRKGARLTGAQREELMAELKAEYEKGATIRGLAEQTGCSYGFMHKILTDSGVTLRGRGGDQRKKT